MSTRAREIVADGVRSAASVECVFQLNIQGLGNKSTVLETFLLENAGKFIAVCLCEHWLRDYEISQCVVAGYHVAAYFARSVKIHGGVAIFMRNNVKYIPIDLSNFCVEVEAEIAAVKIPDQRLIVISIYRSPAGDLNTFMSILSRVFQYLCEFFQCHHSW